MDAASLKTNSAIALALGWKNVIFPNDMATSVLAILAGSGSDGAISMAQLTTTGSWIKYGIGQFTCPDYLNDLLQMQPMLTYLNSLGYIVSLNVDSLGAWACQCVADANSKIKPKILNPDPGKGKTLLSALCAATLVIIGS